MSRELSRRLVALGHDPEEASEVAHVFPNALTEKARKAERTNVLLYMGEDEIERIVSALGDAWNEVVAEAAGIQEDSKKAPATPVTDRIVKDLLKQVRDEASVPDVALFGRMLAGKREFNVDAACQVAHAISTHRVAMEMDYFTAVDDLQAEDELGAGMLGFLGFNSACFYRYARIDWNQLTKNLHGETDLARRTVEGFMRAALAAVPSGKQNSHAAHNPPSFMLAIVREDGMGWSLANAFEKPVFPRRDGGLVGPSVAALDAYWGRLCDVYGTDTLKHIAALSLEAQPDLPHLGDKLVASQEQWVTQTLAALPAEGAAA